MDTAIVLDDQEKSNIDTQRLTRKQRLFIDHYVSTWNATDAAICAGYSKKTAYSIGSENLTKDYIVAEVEKRISQLSEKPLAYAKSALQDLRYPKKRDRSETLYVIRDTHGSCKIGITNDLERRLMVLRTANPYNPQVVFSLTGENVLMVERKLHGIFKTKHIDGEWFKLSDEDIEFVKSEYDVKQKATGIC